jgi:myosin XVIII
MKPWLQTELELKQTAKLEWIFISLQSKCRGSLTRQRLEKLKIKDVAIKCVQKNVRKLLAVRDWSWWKLYQQISPLLKVQSSHEKLQTTQVYMFYFFFLVISFY